MERVRLLDRTSAKYMHIPYPQFAENLSLGSLVGEHADRKA